MTLRPAAFRPLAFLVAAAMLCGCGIPVPEAKRDYVGTWEAPDMRLRIDPDGRVSYWRHKAGADFTVDAPIQAFSGDDVVVGLSFATTTFEVGRPPWREGDRWRMVVDGVELVRSGPAEATGI